MLYSLVHSLVAGGAGVCWCNQNQPLVCLNSLQAPAACPPPVAQSQAILTFRQARLTMDAARQLPTPVLDALTSRAQNDPIFLSLMARIQAGTASLVDNFQFLTILNQVTLEQFGRATQQTAMQPRRPRTRCRN